MSNHRYWLSVKLYAEDLDGLVAQIGDDLSCLSALDPVWYIRYVDVLGPHLRVRASPTVRQLASCLNRIRSLCQRCVERGSARSVSFGPYQPEIWKYQTIEEIEYAAKVWTSSSVLASEIVANTPPEHRFSLAFEAFSAALDCISEKNAPLFLDHYQKYWGPPSKGLVASELDLGDGYRTLLENYSTSLASYVEQEVPGRRSKGYLLFHQVHLMNNRIGLDSGAEAALATAHLKALNF